jgi:hypothetical protein
MRSTSIALAISFTLYGCGVAYVQPSPSEPAAEIFANPSVNESFGIVTTDAKGCYVGGTRIPGVSKAEQPIAYRVKSNARLVMSYGGSSSGNGIGPTKSCKLHFAFVPKEGAKYTMITNQISLPNAKTSTFAKLFAPDQLDYCVVKVVEETADGVISITPLQKTEPRQAGFACIRFP